LERAHQAWPISHSSSALELVTAGGLFDEVGPVIAIAARLLSFQCPQ